MKSLLIQWQQSHVSAGDTTKPVLKLVAFMTLTVSAILQRAKKSVRAPILSLAGLASAVIQSHSIS
jgi:hypothetical protein